MSSIDSSETFSLEEEGVFELSASDWNLVKKVANVLGDQVLRFGPVRTEMLVPSPGKRRIFDQIKRECRAMGLMRVFTDAQILRAVQTMGYSPKRSIRLLKRTDTRYINITAQDLEPQLMTKTLFPLPGVYSPTVDDFFYMRPCRFTPGVTPTSAIIGNLTYVMDSIYERHRDSSRKIGFIANMNDWKMENFSMDYCFQFMEVLQGRKGPNKVDLFLIVNRKLLMERDALAAHSPEYCLSPCVLQCFVLIHSPRLV